MANTINYTAGAARTDLESAAAADIDAQVGAQLLVRDARLPRPSYFDGRFLTANDLTREQTYMLIRQADVASTYRGGVLRGMQLIRSGNTLQIAAGAGFTPSGELVTLAGAMTVSITAVPEDDHIDLSNGLVSVAAPPPANRSGLYVLGLRPDEYTATPTIRYPLAVAGTAGTQDGDIVSVAALALHPLQFTGTGTAAQLRGELARAMFFQSATGMPADLLALAIVQLQAGSIAWLDSYLVRREIAAEDGGIVGLGTVDRALREAQFLQYDAQITELVANLRPGGAPAFPAARYFSVLPAVGRMPVEAIDPAQMTQVFFPPQMTVRLSVVVDDEIPALLDSSFHLPSIDLEGADSDFDNSYIQILVPMPATQIASLQLAPLIVPRTIAPPPVLAQRLPLDALRDLVNARTLAASASTANGASFGTDTPQLAAPLLAAWRSALAAAPDRMVWFVRVPALSVAPAALYDPPPKTKEKEKEKEKEVEKIKEVEKGKDTPEKTKDTPEKTKEAKEAEKGKDTVEKTKEAEKGKDTVEKTKEAEKGKDTIEKGKEIEKAKDTKEIEKTREKAKDTKEIEKAKETIEKVKETGPIKGPVLQEAGAIAIAPTPVAGAPVRTFIQPAERPDVGAAVIAKTKDT